MPYNIEIAERIESIVSRMKAFDSRKMFGGVCQLYQGNMVCGVYKDYLILRLGVEKAAEILRTEHAKNFDITGKPMKGWVMVHEKGFKTEGELKTLIDMALMFVKALPPK